MDRSKTCLVVVSAGVLLLTVGCASEHIKDLNKRLTSLEAVSKKSPNATYIVDPPDTIQIEFLNEPELTMSEQIRSDGVVTLPHVGETKLAGMSTAEIRDKLEWLYAKYYKEPKFVVRVTAYRSKHIYVYGEVGRVGQQPYTGWQTLSDAIGAAGGVTHRAATGRVRIIRGDPKEAEVYKADLDALIHKGDTTQDVSLAENDVVYVPPTVLAWLGYRIDELMFPFRGVLSFLGMARTVSGE